MFKLYVTITDQNWAMRDSIYVDWYECPNCEGNMIIPGASYCQDCGVKLKWSISDENLDLGN